jgi:glycine cleavage system transcriptional repressor
MKRWFALSAIGRDRPGIVADLAELIYECDCNLEDSSMTILGSEFAVLLLLTGDAQDVEARLSAACKRLEWEKRLTVFFRPLEGAPLTFGVSHHARPFELQAVGVDKAGIVARVARCLAEHTINITQMSTASRPEPGTGTPIYHMQIRMDVPQGVDERALRHALDAVAAALNIDLTLQAAQL